jgi:hypothetical protein
MRQETTKLYVKRARLFQRRLAEDILGRRALVVGARGIDRNRRNCAGLELIAAARIR